MFKRLVVIDVILSLSLLLITAGCPRALLQLRCGWLAELNDRRLLWAAWFAVLNALGITQTINGESIYVYICLYIY